MPSPGGMIPALAYLGGLFSGILLRVFGEKYREKGELDEHAFSVLRSELEGDLVDQLLEPLAESETNGDLRTYFEPAWDDIEPHYRYLIDAELRDELTDFEELIGRFYDLEREKRDLETDRAPGDALYYGALSEASPILISATSPSQIHEWLRERVETASPENLSYAVSHWETGEEDDDWSRELWQHLTTGETEPGDDSADSPHRSYWETVREQRRLFVTIDEKQRQLATAIERRHEMPTTRFVLRRYRRALVPW